MQVQFIHGLKPVGFLNLATKQAEEEVDAKITSDFAVAGGWILGGSMLIILLSLIGWPAFLVAVTAYIFISYTISHIQGNIEAELITSMRKKEEETLNSALLATGR